MSPRPRLARCFPTSIALNGQQFTSQNLKNLTHNSSAALGRSFNAYYNPTLTSVFPTHVPLRAETDATTPSAVATMSCFRELSNCIFSTRPTIRLRLQVEGAHLCRGRGAKGVVREAKKAERQAAYEAERDAMGRVRDQLGRHVHAVHRLDGGTSGCLLFAFDAKTTALQTCTMNDSGANFPCAPRITIQPGRAQIFATSCRVSLQLQRLMRTGGQSAQHTSASTAR